MIVFLIVVAVIALIIIAVLSITATVTLVYDKGWHTTVQVLFIKKDIVLSKILSFVLFPEKKAEETAKKQSENQKKKKSDTDNKDTKDASNSAKKPNPIKELYDKDGIVGILAFVTNLLETANSAVTTLIKGLHIYSLYVMILIGGADADITARKYGNLCKYYYPLKGIILNGMKVDNYDDCIQPDFIADKTECEFQLIAGISVGLIVKVGLKAGFVFLKNLIINKKTLATCKSTEKQK